MNQKINRPGSIYSIAAEKLLKFVVTSFTVFKQDVVTHNYDTFIYKMEHFIDRPYTITYYTGQMHW